MDLPTPDIIALLNYLLPGFVTAALLFSLTPSLRPAPFERVVQALIYTIVIQLVVVALREFFLFLGQGFAIGQWSESGRLAWSFAVAVALAGFLAYVANHDTIHRLLRGRGITHQSSYASEWFGALSQNKGYIVLHLEDQRRLLGWAEEWPSTPGEGHFVMSDADWLDGEKITPLKGVAKIIVKAKDVKMVELMVPDTTPRNEANDG